MVRIMGFYPYLMTYIGPYYQTVKIESVNITLINGDDVGLARRSFYL